jgi:hypothetical protein
VVGSKAPSPYHRPHGDDDHPPKLGRNRTPPGRPILFPRDDPLCFHPWSHTTCATSVTCAGQTTGH